MKTITAKELRLNLSKVLDQVFVTFDKSLHKAYKTLPNIQVKLLT